MSEVESLALLAEYQQSREHIFRSVPSIRWFIAQNREELVEAGAILYIANRQQVNPLAFDRVVLAVGQRAALKAVA